MEVFVHGALCVSYSGQCLTSEMWGGRSANRGECAQACRLPYDLMVDGMQKPMGDVAYLLSPKDLAAIDIMPELIEAGVMSFKIEGRLKSPEYVANVVSKYRKAIDLYFDGNRERPSREEIRELQQSFSRGFTHGFLDGTNNKKLVEGTFPKSRGVYLGVVEKILRDGVVCKLEAPVKRGDGIVFDAGDPTQKEEGGRIYDLRRKGVKLEGEAAEQWIVDIVPGRNDIDLRKVHVGDRIWKTNDPALDKRLRQTYETDKPYRVFPVHVKVTGRAGGLLETVWTDVEKNVTVQVNSELELDIAQKRPMDAALLEDQFGRLGGTIFQLEKLEVDLLGDVIVPMRELNSIRRRAVELLEGERPKPPVYVRHADAKPLASPAVTQKKISYGEARLTALCRSLPQVEAALEAGIEFIYADFEFIKQFPAAVEAVRAAGKKIALVTPRIHMPGENGYHNNILRLKPDAVLVRNTGALYFYLRHRQEKPDEFHPQIIGDFSLNIANHKTVELFLDSGCDIVTPSYDLNIQQMVDLLGQSQTDAMEVVIHQHLPMFHTEHCVYCTFLSEGTDFTNCGRPCEEHSVSLQDRIGMSHPVRVDEGCRNTVYNAIEQSGAEYLKNFMELGVVNYRIEFLEETPQQVHEVIELYSKAMRGEISGTQVWKKLKATNQLGVTRGQLIK
jgi:putative protease